MSKPNVRPALLCLCLLCLSTACRALQERELDRYNHLKLSPEAQVDDTTDNGELAAFVDYAFTCRRQSDYLPEEAPAAAAAFERFITEFEAHPTPTVQDKQRRLDLLLAAIAAKSWRAEYLDAIWGAWDNRGNPKEAQPFMDRLVRLAEQGHPLALNGLLTWTNGMYQDMPRRVAWLKAGLEHGNPQIQSSVGYKLGTHSLALRPMALQMLECAAAQGDADAYQGLGRIAWQEGRWVDAYRAWERGANLGSQDCTEKFEEMARLTPGAKLDHEPIDSRLDALRAHYAGQFLFQLSQLASLRRPAPEALQLHFSDAQLVALIKARIHRYGLP
jgi:hypothetical protein